MENITLLGMKEVNQKLSHIERSLNDISKSLALIAKIQNRQAGRDSLMATNPMSKETEIIGEEDDDEVS